MSLTQGLLHRCTSLARDAYNRVRYGRAGPRFAELIWVRPSECGQRVFGVHRLSSGRVQGGNWDLRREPVELMGKVAACMARWGEGRSWEEAGAYARSLRAIAKKGSLDGCRTLDDVVQRYLKLDEVFARVSNEGRLRTRAELEGPAAFRELGGIFINIDRDGRPVAGGGGWHRLAIARILHLPVIPAQVGLVHPAALPSWRQRFSAPAAAGSEPPAA